MTSNTPTERSAPYFGGTWYSVLQSSGADLLDHCRLRLGALAQETSKAFLDRYDIIQDATIRYIHHAAPRSSTPEEIIELESQPGEAQEVTGSDPEPESIPAATLHSYSDTVVLEDDSPEGSGQPTAVRWTHSKHKSMWVPMLIVGLLFLIMVPGLILGIVTRQVAWGIAISGATAPAVVFFGGLYYHHNRSDE